jgi:hypothetical protein
MSKSAAPVSDRIIRRVRAKGHGWVFTPKHFVDFGTRGSIDMALSRLAKAGLIRRIDRGLYNYPRQHAKLGALSPDADSIAPHSPRKRETGWHLRAPPLRTGLDYQRRFRPRRATRPAVRREPSGRQGAA